MVYSSELGYDPDEWEECPDEEHRMLFGFFTRMFLSLFAIGCTVFLLWLMEARKQWAKAAKEYKEPVFMEKIVKKEDEGNHVIGEPSQKLVSETRVEPSFTKEEEEALEEWRREVARLEEARLRELDDRMCDGSSGISEIETESQLIESFLPADEIPMDLETADLEQFQVLKNVCATPPCTPPDTSGIYGKTLPFEEITKKLAADGQIPSEMPSEQQEFEMVKETSTMDGSGLADWEAPPVAEFLGEPGEVYSAKSIGEPIAEHIESSQVRVSTDGEEGFVKVYEEHEEKLKERYIAEIVSKAPKGVAEIEHIYDVPAAEIGSQDTQLSISERIEGATSVEARYNIGIQPETQQVEDYPRVPLEPEVVFGRSLGFESAGIQHHPDAPQVATHLKSGADISQVAATSEQNLDISQVPPIELSPSLPIRTSSISEDAKVEHAEHIIRKKYMQQMDQKEAEELRKLFEEYDILEKPNERTDIKSSIKPHDTHPLTLQEVEQTPIHIQQGITQDHKIDSTIGFYSDEQKEEYDEYVNIVGEEQGISRVRLSVSEYPAIRIASDEVKRLAEADIYVQDAMEYVSSQRPTDTISGFVIEEDMLESVERSGQAAHLNGQNNAPASAEATSQLVKTNEAFEKVEQIAEIDDTMTYAPEIQSIEIPPDQASENSENLQEYFDQVAAECTNVFKMPLVQARAATAGGTGMAARRLEYSPSISSIRSGKSYTSSEGLRKQSSLLSALGVTSMQEMLLTLTSLEALSAAMAKAGLESTNLIFGIDYTASNKYQGEQCFGGRSLHSLDPLVPNPYQQVISVMGRTLAPFATSGFIPAYGFGDSKTGDWSVFKLKRHGECHDLDEVLSVYNEVTPTISLSGPTNFAPLIYQAIEICEKVQDYHILVIVADGQVTNEKATRKAIVRACQYPLSIIVVGVGDGPWEMMRIFDESLPKRPWDNFHFVEFDEVMHKASSIDSGEVTFAIQSLLEIPDQYNTVRQLGLIRGSKSVSKAK